jgi:hypothetical protein
LNDVLQIQVLYHRVEEAAIYIRELVDWRLSQLDEGPRIREALKLDLGKPARWAGTLQDKLVDIGFHYVHHVGFAGRIEVL